VWLAFDGTWFSGRETFVDGILNPDRQRNKPSWRDAVRPGSRTALAQVRLQHGRDHQA
jgi:hypothetical protein